MFRSRALLRSARWTLDRCWKGIKPARACSGVANNGAYCMIQKHGGNKIKEVTTNVGLRSMSTITSRYADLEFPRVDFADYIMQDFDKYPNAVALVNGVTGKKYTYHDMEHYIRAIGSGLTKAGFKPNDVCCIFLENCPEFVLTYFAVIALGGTASPANYGFTPYELTYQIKDSRAKFLITQDSHINIASIAAEKSDGLITDIYVVGEEVSGYKAFNELLHDDGSEFPDRLMIDTENSIATIPYSSGTTGLPKGVQLTHNNLTSNLSQFTSDQRMLKMGRDDVVLAVLPLYHLYGTIIIMAASLLQGATLVTMPKFEPKNYLDLVTEYKVNVMFVVPYIVLFLAKHPLVQNYDLSHVKDMISAAAPLGDGVYNSIANKIGPNKLRQAYGLTETSPVLTMEPRDGLRAGSVGKVVPNTEIRVVDTTTGKLLGPNEDGEIWARGPQIMKGYINQPDVTSETIDKDGFLHTGDIGHYDEDGYFYIVDRLKDIIKYKGYQVAPAEIEQVVNLHPDVAEAAVVPVPDERAGEVPRGYVVLKPEANLDTIVAEIECLVAEHLADFKRLRGGMLFIDEIPKSPSGKILRRVLRDRALNEG